MRKESHDPTCCPTCGAKLNDSGTKVDLDDNFIMHGDRVTFVPAAQAEILYALWKKMPAVVRRSDLIAAMYGGGDTPENADNILSVQVSGANQRIASLGLVIETAWGVGYALRAKKEIAA